MTAPWEVPLPADWKVTPLSTVVAETRRKNKGLSETNLLSLSYGRIVRRNIDSVDGLVPASYETYQIVEPGQVVIRLTDLQNDTRSLRSGSVVERGIITSAYTTIESVGIESRYLAWLLRGYDHQKVFYSFGGGVRQSLTFSDLKRLPTLLPPIAEQERIADYLDRETATIDTLIEKQRRLVAGLRSRRTAVIVEATTGERLEGIRRASSSSWLDDVPEGWSELPLKRVLSGVQTGFWGTDEAGDGTDVRVVRVADFDRPTLSVGTAPTIRSVKPAERMKAELRRGDLLMEKSGGTGINPVGFVVSYESDVESIFANFIVRLRLREEQHQRFWLYALNGAYVSGLTWKSVNQTTGIQNLDMTSLLSEFFPVPPLDEQREIADHLDRETAKIDALIEKAERFIELAQERRAALITAAVTGQIEIPTED